LDFGYPPGDEGGVCAGFESCAVADELGVAFLDHLFGTHCGRINDDVELGVVEGLDGVRQMVW
jgi:hypothetical protein